jgi:AcrR family transcriptional regulator
MPKTMIKPGPDLLQRVNKAFLDYGYSGLSMVTMAKACGFTQRALYYYFSNKEDAFRAIVQYRNDEAMDLARAAGQAIRANGGSALDIIAEILDVRYGGTRRRVNRSPHMVELNAEVFKRCRDIVIQVGVAFQAELEQLIVDLEKSRMLTLNGRFAPAQIAQGLADGGRAVNQAVQPIADEDYKGRYRQACEMVLYGCATMPKPKISRPKTSKRKTPKRK